MKFCPECGTNINGAKFCPGCGMKTNASSTNVLSNDHNYYVQQNQPPPPPEIPATKPIGTGKVSPVPATAPIPYSNQSSTSPSSTMLLVIPVAASGEEAEGIHQECITKVRAAGGEQAVADFKKNCRAFGVSKLNAASFYDSLVSTLGEEDTAILIPNLARLIPSAEKRKELIEEREARAVHRQGPAYLRHSSSSFSSTRDSIPNAKSNPNVKKGFMSDRYADHPNCDICNLVFDVTKRRHQCRFCGQFICSSCSPAKMLIPAGQEIQGARGYHPSHPQRICLTCVPLLADYQEELRQAHGLCNKENPHEAADRIHLPYSDSLEKECRNAADILGNFFRGKWGANADQAVPIAFLKNCKGLAFMTIIKAGFLFTGKVGTGLIIARLPNGSWSAPSAIGTIGFGTGFEIGGELIQLMLVLGSEGAVKVFHRSQVNVGAGLDLAIGPYGRVGQVAAAAGAGGLNANYSYSHAKGFFAGMSLQGAVIATRKDLNRKFYGKDVTARDILTGDIPQPTAAQPLYDAIEDALANVQEYKEIQDERAIARGACGTCGCERFVPHTTQLWKKDCKRCKHFHIPNQNRPNAMR